MNTLVKGTDFDNWRSVGTAEAAARLFNKRDVDELMLLDVTASRQNRHVSFDLIRVFAEVLEIPFSVGGGIDSLDIASECLKQGAEKVVIGAAWHKNPTLIKQLSQVFGDQAVVVTLDVFSLDPFCLYVNQEPIKQDLSLEDVVTQLTNNGAGEILLQSVAHDGKMNGMNLEVIENVSSYTTIPIVASSGAGRKEDFLSAIKSGASSVAAGAIFQFTQTTPRIVHDYLESSQIRVRKY